MALCECMHSSLVVNGSVQYWHMLCIVVVLDVYVIFVHVRVTNRTNQLVVKIHVQYNVLVL